MTLATAWTAANPLGALDSEATKRPAALRTNIAAAISLMASADAGHT